jgi:hypothetical protein
VQVVPLLTSAMMARIDEAVKTKPALHSIHVQVLGMRA